MQTGKKLTKEKIVALSMLSIIALVILVLCIVNWGSLSERLATNFIRKGNFKAISTGLLYTFVISILGFLIGIILGAITCLVDGIKSDNTFVLGIKQIFKAYVSICRGTPTVVQLLVIYFVIFASYSGPTLFVAVLAFGLNSGAYIAEILRGGINSVPVGQMEAGRSLGLSYSKVMVRVVFPQAIKNSLPSLGNEFVTLIKETSVASFIAIIDFTNAMKHIADATYDYTIVYIVMGIVYFVIVYVVTKLLSLLERRLNLSGK